MASMPERIWISTHSSTARSSISLKAASESFPPANWSRASFRYAGRKRLPTTSLRYTVPSTARQLRKNSPDQVFVTRRGHEARNGHHSNPSPRRLQVETIVPRDGMLRDSWLLLRALLWLLGSAFYERASRGSMMRSNRQRRCALRREAG